MTSDILQYIGWVLFIFFLLGIFVYLSDNFDDWGF